MKPSGVPWLGDIPVGWDTIQFSLGIERIGTGLNPRDNFELSKTEPYYYVTIRNFKNGKLFLDEACDRITPEAWKLIQSRSELRKGDILFASISKDGQAYLLDEEPTNWNINESVFSLRVKNNFFVPRFFYYQITSSGFYDDLLLDATGSTFQSIKQNKLLRSRLVIPPIPEQRAIADFLDEKCAAIDAIVEEAKAGIEEYAKWKQSVVFQAVTKGLDPHAKMKDSGVEWIGEIPEEWKVLPLKRHVDMLTPMRDKPEDLSGLIPWIRIEDFEGKFISKSKDGLGVSAETISQMNLKVYPVGTVLCTSSCDLGKCAIVSTPLVSNQRFIGIIPKPSISSDFLYYLMLSNAERLNMLSTGTIQANLSRVEFERLRVQIPPLPEQRAIAAYLDEKCSAIDALIEEKKQLIEDLGVYKKSLIYETVTGKRKIA